jgi:hypothetical protein
MVMNDFVLQIKCDTKFRLHEALRHIPEGEREITLNDGSDDRRRLHQDRRVYLWEAGAGGRDLVGTGTVLAERNPRPMPNWQHAFLQEPHDPSQKKAVIRVDVRLDPPVSRAQVLKDPQLAAAPFFGNSRNVQGAVFKVEPRTAAALDRLIECETRRADGFAKEVPVQFLDIVSHVDWDSLFDPNDEQDARLWQLRAIAFRSGPTAVPARPTGGV